MFWWVFKCCASVFLCTCDLRVAESTEEVTKLRPARLIKEDGIIRPYDPTESQGFDLFQVRLIDFFHYVSDRKLYHTCLCHLGSILLFNLEEKTPPN